MPKTRTSAARCDGKGQCPTHAAALDAMWNYCRRSGASPDALRVYQCGDHYHFGHQGRPHGKSRKRRDGATHRR